MVKVFLSHSSKDKAEVRRLAIDLREQGVDVWLDEWEIGIGDSISRRIDEGLHKADFLAIWLTESAVSSGWVDREWRAKFEEEISSNRTIVLPLLADEVPLPTLLRDKRYADFREDYAYGLSQLLSVSGLTAPSHASIYTQEDRTCSPSKPVFNERGPSARFVFNPSPPLIDVVMSGVGVMSLLLILYMAFGAQEKGLIDSSATVSILSFSAYAVAGLALVTVIAITVVSVKRRGRKK